MLSGDLAQHKLTDIPTEQQKNLFPETIKDSIWTRTDYVRRYNLTFPFYPFRTLCPRDFTRIASVATSSSKEHATDFNPTSPLFPANTQINIVFKKRKEANFLPYMLPFNLQQHLGTQALGLTDEEKTLATTYSVTTRGAGPNAAVTTQTYVITSVNIKLENVYLQVGLTPLPLSPPHPFFLQTLKIDFLCFRFVDSNTKIFHPSNRCLMFSTVIELSSRLCKKLAYINMTSAGNRPPNLQQSILDLSSKKYYRISGGVPPPDIRNPGTRNPAGPATRGGGNPPAGPENLKKTNPSIFCFLQRK